MKNAITQANEVLRMLKRDSNINKHYRDTLQVMANNLQKTLDEPIFKKEPK